MWIKWRGVAQDQKSVHHIDLAVFKNYLSSSITVNFSNGPILSFMHTLSLRPKSCDHSITLEVEQKTLIFRIYQFQDGSLILEEKIAKKNFSRTASFRFDRSYGGSSLKVESSKLHLILLLRHFSGYSIEVAYSIVKQVRTFFINMYTTEPVKKLRNELKCRKKVLSVLQLISKPFDLYRIFFQNVYGRMLFSFLLTRIRGHQNSM